MNDLACAALFSDRYASLKAGGRYQVTCTGWRVQPLSWYRNIVAAEEV